MHLYILPMLLLSGILTSCNENKTIKSHPEDTQSKTSITDTLNHHPHQANLSTSLQKQHTILYDTSLISITQATQNDFDIARNNYTDDLLYDTIHSKQNGTIKLRISNPNKQFIAFTDTKGEEERQEYRYIGQFKTIGYYLIAGLFWEQEEYYLINKTSGEKTTIWNKPKLSPTTKYIANLSPAFGLEGTPNGLQIWRVENDKQNIKKITEIDQSIWAPYSFYWETETSLILNSNPTDKYYTQEGNLNTVNSSFIRIHIK